MATDSDLEKAYREKDVETLYRMAKSENIRRAYQKRTIDRLINEKGRLMFALADIARYSPDVYDAVGSDGDLYQSAGMADLLELARVWQGGG